MRSSRDRHPCGDGWGAVVWGKDFRGGEWIAWLAVTAFVAVAIYALSTGRAFAAVP
ncbi:hypothetical protein [Streptomyces sp. TE33382]